jgi:hypothetical protein
MRSPARSTLRAAIASSALIAAACASNPVRPIATVPGGDLPSGQGKVILQAACTVCHDLGEVTKFRGYYGKEQWQDVVMTMVRYGARVNEENVAVLVEYLTQTLGRREP